ncbi:MAG: 50S ribosomal protein L15 [Saprospiraceae bacterium]
MELHNLKPAEGSKNRKKRIARGQGSGWAGTAGRGHKGAKSRSGSSLRANFEGGQTPMQRRLPKRGFKNPNRIEYVGLNLDSAQALAEKYKLSEISPETLYKNKIIGKNDRIKILGRGEVTSALNVKAHAISASAKQAIEEKGGSVNLV